jgi:hypothetical protein
MNAPWPGPLGPPPDLPATVATIGGILLLWQGRRFFNRLLHAPRRFVLPMVAGLALLLSAWYVHHYLRGGPRIIDATSYWLQAKALAHGYVTWPISEPTASVRGRFLLTTGPFDAPRVGVIFPPGYPLALALGFLARAPLFMGPLTAALLVVATYALAKAVSARDDVALLAACLSALSASMRYHTADTMSHGWAALLFTASLALAYRASPRGAARGQIACAAFSGALFGWLFATRPISAIALAPVLAFACIELRPRTRIALCLAAAIPVLLFFLQQRALTGSIFRSSQFAYYALADGPPGCFRYGFGDGIGCLHEHGAYVESVLPNGLHWRAATLTTLRRLRLHLIDVANAEPLVFLALAAPFLAARGAKDLVLPRALARRVLAIACAVVLIVAAYVPFYFDGSYPGGGARFFVDVLPEEHVLISVAVGLLVERVRARAGWLDFARAAALVCAVSLLGFGIHAAYEHVSLRDRDGGRPMFEASVLAKANVDHGLLFMGTDHAFNLAYDPRANDAAHELVVAREYGDDRDRLLWERLGRPIAHRYVFDGTETSKPSVVPWSAGPIPHPYRFEAEAEWPPVSQSGGYLEPTFARGTCAWGGRLLAIHTRPDQPFHGTISFPVPFPGRFRVGVHVASRGETVARFVLRYRADDPPLATWSFTPPRRDLTCATLPEEEVILSDRAFVEVAARGSGDLFLDAVALEPATAAERAR